MAFFNIIIFILYLLIFSIGIIGNCFVLLIIYFEKRTKKSTNILIMNLAIADLLFILIYIPESTTTLFGKNLLPESSCRYQMFLTYISIFASAYTLVLLAFDRLVAVVYPLRAIYLRTFKNTIISCCIIWIISFIVYFFTFFLSTNDDGDFSMSKNRTSLLCFDVNKISDILETNFNIQTLYFTFNITSYIIPLLAIIVMYTIILNFLHKIKSKKLKTTVNKQWRRRITKTIWLVIATFAICWFPQNLRIFYIAITYKNNSKHNEYLFKTHNMIITVIFQILAYSNYCINPVLYCLMLKRYRWYINNFWIFIRSFFINTNNAIVLQRKRSFTALKSPFNVSYPNSIGSNRSNNHTNV
uniref:G_PROTEIN_RECEP_F1_2 domain-containing protein n=1 Tax=Strongyloides stercoralis TaxID=6248 RepID=A0A0K0EIT7_STRER